jgi:hypothetical protein
MTPEVRRAAEWDCTRLIHLYAQLNDARRWSELAALYTVDGSMTRPTAPNDPIIGRAAILAAFEARAPRTTRHICANVVIDVESEHAASGTSAMLLFTSANGPPLVGGFEDRFIKSDEGWRFAERRGLMTF